MRQNLGIALICISAFLYGVRYLSAAIYGSSMQVKSKPFFTAMLEYVGLGPLVLSWIALSLGVFVLVFPKLKNPFKQDFDFEQIKENWNSADPLSDPWKEDKMKNENNK